MYRYFVLLWNSTDALEVAAAQDIATRPPFSSGTWQRVLESPGVLVFDDRRAGGASLTRLLPRGAGAIFGRMFRRDLGDPLRVSEFELDAHEMEQIIRSGGRHLVSGYWGRYVALILSADTGERFVLRDPLGGMPCLHLNFGGVHVVFSDMDACAELGLMRFSVNWDYIRRLIADCSIQSRVTALQQVTEIQPGERVRFARGCCERSLEWHPVAIARDDCIDDPQRAAVELRRMVRACVHAWASCYSAVVHNLSGGLDSSIVLSALRDAPSRPRITCLHYFGLGPEEDERKYARLMSDRVGATLIERRLDPDAVDLQRLSNLRRSSRPWFYLYELEHGRFEGELAARTPTSGLFSGAGGDAVFFQARADLAVADCLLRCGLSRRLLNVAMDAARVCDSSIWSLLFRACSRSVRASAADRYSARQPPRTLLHPELLRWARRDEFVSAAWDASSASAPPGLQWQLGSIAVPPAFYESFHDGHDPERTLPLLSQPLVELCVRIPSYLTIRHGVDRSIARTAFASDLPSEIYRRRQKGRIDRHLRDVLDRNLSFVRERLLDGRLVREGLLDRKVLETYLTRESSAADFQYTEILQEHLCIEAWLASWLDQPFGHDAVRGAGP